MVDWIGKVIKVKKNSFVTDTEREFEMPFDLEGVTAETLNEWLNFFIEQLNERQEVK